MQQRMPPPVAELRRLALEFQSLRDHLMADRIEFSVLMGAERDLNSLTQCTLARLATDSEKALAFEQVLECVEQAKRVSHPQPSLKSCWGWIGILCGGRPAVEHEVLRVLSLAAELGRTVGALRLVDRALQLKGPRFVSRMLERVKLNVVGGGIAVGRDDPTENKVVQLASRLALERISSNSVCPPAMRSTASALIERVDQNLKRLSGGTELLHAG